MPPSVLRLSLAARFAVRRPAVLPSSVRSLSASASSSSSASPSSSSDPLLYVTNLPAPDSGHIRILELNRPAARNALSRALVDALRAQVDDVAAQYDARTGDEVVTPATATQRLGPTRALIVASAVDACFCAGADLKERRTFSPEETAAFLQTLRSTLAALAALPVPTVAAVAAPALGGGLELALAAHLRVLAATAVVGLPETRLGIVPGAGGTFRLPALIGVARARDLVLTGRRVTAAEAYFLGIADRLVDTDKEAAEQPGDEKKEAKEDEALTPRRAALAEAVRVASEICEGAPVAVRAALQAVQHPAEAVENAMYARVVATRDRDEALLAFAEKRRPVFLGR